MSIVLSRKEERQYERIKWIQEQSLEELRERAQEMNIDGREKMKKRELLHAIWRRYN